MHVHHPAHHRHSILRILITLAGLILLPFFPLGPGAKLAAYLAFYLLIGGDILKKAAQGMAQGRIFSETFLMSLATLGAFALALLTRSGDYLEAVAVMLLYQIGELLEHWAVDKSRKNIAGLMDIRPDQAHMEQNGQLIPLHPAKVAVGSIIQVRPGEKVPLDGVVEDGISALNTMALTGESMPRDVQPGDEVLSGSVNMQGLLRIRTTQTFARSTVSVVLEKMEQAAENKARTEHFIRRFAKGYTPLVCILALALAVLPPLFHLIANGTFPFAPYLYRALTFLVISCPCALVIGVPLTFFAGMGGASRAGILVKGAQAMENMARVQAVLMDKTGTLTKGQFAVTALYPHGLPEKDLLSLAAHAECASSHPIARSLRQAFGGEICPDCVQDIREMGGRGVYARVNGRAVLAGNERLMQEQRISFPPCEEIGTKVYVAVDGRFAGCIVIADETKPQAGRAIRELNALGVREIWMLTGDEPRAAQKVAADVGLDRVQARLLPQHKMLAVEQVMNTMPENGQVMFVGDGINDAPALARADIGVAMGGLGSDAAMEAADVVLMDDDPLQIPRAIRIAKRTMGIVKQNIAFSLAVKFLFLLLSAFGIVQMGAAVFADVGVMVLVVLNAIRALQTQGM